MGSLLQTMANGNSYKNIHVKEIRINPLNFYSRMEEEGFYVDSMATILAEDGQDSSAVVYYDDSKEDGKKYTLIAGERRYKAMLSNLKMVSVMESYIARSLRSQRMNWMNKCGSYAIMQIAAKASKCGRKKCPLSKKYGRGKSQKAKSCVVERSNGSAR